MPRLIQSGIIAGLIFQVGSIIIWPWVIVSDRYNKKKVNHAYIHVMQIRRSQAKYGKIKGVIFWYASYLNEWRKAGFKYELNKYEIEAFGNENNPDYISSKDPELWEEIKHLIS